MVPALVKGFAIGFLTVAVGAGVYGWRQGWFAPSSDAPGVTSVAKSPDAARKPAPGAQAPRSGSDKAPSGLAAIEPLTKANPSSPQAAPKPPASDPEKGAFDIVRVEPSGEMVVAGRCAANCTVALTANGKTHETVKADAAGNWAMTPPALPPGDHQLGLVVTAPDGKTATSEQSVTVSVPKERSGEVVVVLNEPNAPSKVLQRPGQPPAAAQAETAAVKPEAKKPDQALAAVSIVAVDAEKGRLFVQGAAPSGATLRVYLNNTLIAEPVAGGDGRWSVRVEKGLTAGEYAFRVDHIEKPSGKVIARGETRFAYEGLAADAASAKPSEPKPAAALGPSEGVTSTFGGGPAWNAAAGQQPKPDSSGAPAGAAVPDAGSTSYYGGAGAGAAAAQASDPANPVVASIDTAKVERGDSLWRISRKTYGKGMRYTVIFSANDKQIRNPNLIYPGQVLVVPNDAAAGGTVTR